MEVFRKIEPDRPVVCLFEDIDAIIETHGDSELLQWLDGSHQINKVINIATTNYPERLDRRIVSRPRRFDRIIKIESPTAAIRETYLSRKLPDLAANGQLAHWVTMTEGLSFAALAELLHAPMGDTAALREAVAAISSTGSAEPAPAPSEETMRLLETDASQFDAELLLMAALFLVARPAAHFAQAVVANQMMIPGLTNLVRWQSHWHVVRQGWTFFQRIT